MSKLLSFIQQNKLFTALIIFGFFLSLFFHTLWLDRVPPGMSHDEVVYALSSKAFFLQGTDITGTRFPVSLFATPTEGNISVLPTVFLSALNYFMPMDQTTVKLPYIFFLMLDSIALFFIVENLLGNEKVALLASLLFLFEPWSFFLARFATEPPIALMLYLWAIAIILLVRGWKLSISFVLFTCAFYSYHGEKIIFLPLIAILLGYLLYQKRISKKEVAIFLFGSIAIFLSFFLISITLPSSIAGDRSSEIFFLNKQFVASQVNTKRSLLLANSFTPFFTNKFTIILEIFFKKFITAFSVQTLFIQGDPRVIYSFFYHGLLYITDAIFILLGLFFTFLKQKRVGWLIVAILSIAPIPSAISAVGDSYINRSMFLLPTFVLLASVGLYETYVFLAKKTTMIMASALLIAIIGSFVARFLFFYFFQYPLVISDYYSLGEKIAAEFLYHSWDGKKQFIIITQEPGELYLETAFYLQQKEISNSFISNIQKFNVGTYQLSHITFTGDCPKVVDPHIVYLVQNLRSCPALGNAHKWIKNPKDAGVIYSIYNENICSNISSPPWTLHESSDYGMQTMNIQTFCEKWISS